MSPGRSASFQLFLLSCCGERPLLFSDSELRNYFTVAFNVIQSEVIEQTPALAYDLQQASPGPMILFMRFKVLGQIVYAFAK